MISNPNHEETVEARNFFNLRPAILLRQRKIHETWLEDQFWSESRYQVAEREKNISMLFDSFRSILIHLNAGGLRIPVRSAHLESGHPLGVNCFLLRLTKDANDSTSPEQRLQHGLLEATERRSDASILHFNGVCWLLTGCCIFIELQTPSKVHNQAQFVSGIWLWSIVAFDTSISILYSTFEHLQPNITPARSIHLKIFLRSTKSLHHPLSKFIVAVETTMQMTKADQHDLLDRAEWLDDGFDQDSVWRNSCIIDCEYPSVLTLSKSWLTTSTEFDWKFQADHKSPTILPSQVGDMVLTDKFRTFDSTVNGQE